MGEFLALSWPHWCPLQGALRGQMLLSGGSSILNSKEEKGTQGIAREKRGVGIDILTMKNLLALLGSRHVSKYFKYKS